MATVAKKSPSDYEGIMAQFNVTVRPYNDPRRPNSRWVVNVYDPRKEPSRRRARLFFPTREQADAEAVVKRTEFENAGLMALGLTPRQRIEAFDAYQRLSEHRIGLAQVVSFYLENHRNSAVSIDELVKAFQAHSHRIGRAERTIQNQNVFFSRFLLEHGDKKNVSDFDRNGIEDWLHGGKLGPQGFNTYRALLASLFEFAVRRWDLQRNPVKNIEPMRVARDKVCILSPESMLALIKATSARPENSDVLAYLALGGFAGLRPESEIARLRWEHIDLHVTADGNDSFGLIDVPAENKTAQQRYVRILSPLAAILATIRPGNGRILRTNFRRRFKAIRDAAAVHWGHDILRHSYASYHLARFEDAAALALQMGHANTSMIFGNYRQRVKRSEAEKWWSLSLTSQSQITMAK